MTSTTMRRTDSEVRQAVGDELDWAPDVDATGIGIAVQDGSVTLSGEVRTYAARVAATSAALRDRGVTAVADELVVNPPDSGLITDAAIAQAIDHAFSWSSAIPSTVKAKVHHGHVTLTGEADWDFQRTTAQHLVRGIAGVREIVDLIELTPRVSATAAAQDIRDALARNAGVDADRVLVVSDGTTVTLSGPVSSPAERRQAEQAAWASPHVAAVVNRLTVEP